MITFINEDTILDKGLEWISSLLEKSVKNRDVVIIFGRCQIDYLGRSRSILPEGDRIIIIKNNWSVLVHRPYGYNPVNWQPESNNITFTKNDNKVVMSSVRESPREILIVHFSRIYSVIVATGLKDDAKFTMYLTEDEVKNILEENPEIIEKGLKILEREHKIETGFVDFIAQDKNGSLVLIEVKDERAGIESAKQLLRYVVTYRNKGVKTRGILVAPSFSKGAIEFLTRNQLEKSQYDPKKLLEVYIKRINEKKEKKKEGKDLLDFIYK